MTTNQATLAAPTVRDATDDDLPAIHAIYTHHVLHGRASFEETPPTLDEMRERRAAVLAKGLPYLVAELRIDGRPVVAGYAYASTPRLSSPNTSRCGSRPHFPKTCCTTTSPC